MMTSAQRNFLTGSFNPMSLSPALWLSDTGSDQAVWPDISGNGRNAAQADAAKQPAIIAAGLNGRQVRRFDGGDMLSGSRILSGANFSCFMVMKGAPQASKVLLAQRSWPAVNTGRLELISTDELAPNQVHRVFLNNGTGYNVKATTVSLNNTFKMVYSQNDQAGTMHCRVDGGGPEGSISGQSLTPENVPYSVGGGVDLSRTFTGDIAEIIVFPTALSDPDRQKVEAYLRAKWDITFNPLSLSPALWLSDTGSDPATWPDISGNGRNATQSDASRRPAIISGGLNGRQVRRFDGTDDSLSLTTGLGMLRNVSGATVVAVYKWITNPVINKSVFFASVNANADLSRLYLGGGVASRKLLTGGRRLDNDSFARCDSSTDNSNSFFIHSGVINYANSDLFQYVNGTLDGVNTSFQTDGNTSNTDSSLITVGTAGTALSNCANVEIAEILVFPTALNATDRQNVEAYLKNKWLPDFNPLSLSPALWLSDTGSEPSVWPDISGNARNATQATAASQPAIVTGGLNGRQVRRFDGTDDCLFYPDFHTANITIFAVYKPANNGNVQTLLRKGFTTGISGEYNMRSNNATTVLFGLPSAFTSSTKIAGGNWIVQAGWADSSFVSSSVNGGSVTSVSGASAIPNNSFRGRIGSSYASESDTAGFAQVLLGDIAEILVFPTALSDTNRQRVEDYLKNKWLPDFNPLSLSPALWLDASDASTLYDATTGGNLVAANGTVARWADKSGNSRHATQATSGDRPIRKTSLVNGRDILLYDSSDKLTCSLTLAPNFSIFIAGQRDNTAGSAFAGNLQNGGSFDGIVIGIFAASVNNFKTAAVRVGGSETSTTNVNIGTSAVVASVVVQPTSYTGWVNGANESTVSASYNNKDTSFTIGSGRSGSTAGESMVGKIFEVFVFTYALSTTDRQAVESYLRTKWGTP